MSYENISYAMTPGEFDGRYCTGHDTLFCGGFPLRHPMSPQNRPRFVHDRAAGTTKRPYIVVNPTERSTMQRYIVNNPIGGMTMQRYIVDNPTGGLTMQRYIVNNPTGGLTMQRYIVDNPTGGMTMQRYIVNNPTGGLTMQGRIVMDSIVETIKQCGFRAMSIASGSKQQTLKTNPYKKPMIS